MDVVDDKSNNLGPIELTPDVLDCLGNAWVSSKVMVMVGAKDIQLDVLIVRDLEQSLVAKEVAILLE